MVTDGRTTSHSDYSADLRVVQYFINSEALGKFCLLSVYADFIVSNGRDGTCISLQILCDVLQIICITEI